jgi:hypothetical protein
MDPRRTRLEYVQRYFHSCYYNSWKGWHDSLPSLSRMIPSSLDSLLLGLDWITRDVFFSNKLWAFFVCVALGFFAGRRASAAGDFARGTERFFDEILSAFGDSRSSDLSTCGDVDLCDTPLSKRPKRAGTFG